MNVPQIISALIEERNRIDGVIASLRALGKPSADADGAKPKRGRRRKAEQLPIADLAPAAAAEGA